MAISHKCRVRRSEWLQKNYFTKTKEHRGIKFVPSGGTKKCFVTFLHFSSGSVYGCALCRNATQSLTRPSVSFIYKVEKSILYLLLKFFNVAGSGATYF